MPQESTGLGVGFYNRADAARLLRVNSDTLRRWVGGYAYTTASGRHHQEPVIPPSVPELEGEVALSFVDLIELRVVKALLDRGLSLQLIRKARDLAQEHFPVPHPFASRRVYTPKRGHRKSVFIHAFSGEEADFIELTKAGYLQIQAAQLVEGFLEEIEFDEATALAHRWWPMGRNVPVLLDPDIAFGAPVVEGSGVRTEVVAGLAARTSATDAARAFKIDEEGAQAAVRFEGILRAA